jgi:hypothetical protein
MRHLGLPEQEPGRDPDGRGREHCCALR